jgi:biotin transport system substrate-specific component
MLCGVILGAKRGALAVLLFLSLVALGLPLLAGGRGGLGVFTTPWAGFLFGFPAAAYTTGYIMEKFKHMPISFAASAAAFFGSIIVLYVIAIPYYMIGAKMDLFQSLLTMSPFIPGDIIKCILAGFIANGIHKARPDSVLSWANSR